jgi:TPR repeat protein
MHAIGEVQVARRMNDEHSQDRKEPHAVNLGNEGARRRRAGELPFEPSHECQNSNQMRAAFIFLILLFQQKPLRERLLDSALSGDAEAQFELGKNYETGRIGLPKDFAQAERWYRASANQGDPYAEASLGLLYQFGKGVHADPVQALMWYEVAITRASPADRDSIVDLRNDIVSAMTPAQIAEARRLALEFKPRSDNEIKR